MSTSSLCSHCKLINFDTLRGPTDEDLEHVLSGTGPIRLAKARDGAAYDKVHLGSLSRIRASSSTCALCSLFLDVIARQGGAYHDSHGVYSVDSQHIYFRADPDLSYFARIVAQNSSEETYFVLRRLCITAQEEGTDLTVVYIDHAFQLCNVGEMSREPGFERPGDGSAMAFAGRKRPSKVDMSLVTQWIQICLSEHGKTCRPPSNVITGTSAMKIFRLIDVHRKCVCEFRDVEIEKLQYIALSYVWGTTQFLRTTAANLAELQQQGALNRTDLPQTIADSMDLVRRLEFRYLWVDALCIVQDSIEDKAEQIGHMANVYSSAFFSIVAASGIDAAAGLAGLTKARNLQQQEVVVVPPSQGEGGLSILSCLKPHPSKFDEYYTRGQESVDLARWSHRGWTLQETALPSRKLIFTDEQVFWSCRSGYYCEESRFEIPKFHVKHFNNSVHKITLEALANDTVDPWAVYDGLVTNFTRRDLSYDGDVADAFVAVTDSLSAKTGDTLLFGIPRSLFELGLMWETSHGVTRRTAISTLPMLASGERSHFPTWSWMGWKGESSCMVTNARRETESSMIVCFLHRRNPLRLAHITRSSGDHGAKESEIWTEDDIAENRITTSDIQTHLPRLTPECLEKYPDEQLLFFRTASATFTVEYFPMGAAASFKDYGKTPLPRIKNSRGEQCGSVCRIRSEDPSSPTAKYDTAEFIQVGLRRDPEIPEEILPPRVLVLQISRDEKGVANRVNYGDIEMGAWEEAQPQRCLVALA